MGNLKYKHFRTNQSQTITMGIFILPTRPHSKPLLQQLLTVVSHLSSTSLHPGAHLASALVPSTRATSQTTQSLSLRSLTLTTTLRAHRQLASRPCPPSRSTRTAQRLRPCAELLTRV